MRHPAWICGAVVVFLAGCGGPSKAEIRQTAVVIARQMVHKTEVSVALRATRTASAGYTLTGTLTAPQCGSGYEIEDAAVIVRNENNTIIGNATTSFNTLTTAGSAKCHVTFTAKVAPAQRYQVEIGSHTGPVYSIGEMKAHHWHIDLNLS